MNPTETFLQARDFLLAKREDYRAAYDGFRWPRFEHFNWALDYFDVYACDNHRPALWVVNESGEEVKRSFAEMSARSNQVANFLHRLGLRRGDRVLVMLGNIEPLWLVTLAALKLSLVISPATTLLTRADLQDRLERGRLRHVIADPVGAAKVAGLSGLDARVIVGGTAPGWTSYAEAAAEDQTFSPEAPTRADDPIYLYFTSGTAT